MIRCSVFSPHRTSNQPEKVEQNVDSDIDQADGCESQRLVVEPQTGKRNGCNGISRQNQGKPSDVLRLVWIINPGGDLRGKHPRSEEKNQRRHQQRDERGAEHLFLIRLLSGEAEKCCFEAVSEHDQQKCDVRIHLCNHTKLLRIKHPGVQWNQQVIEQTTNDGTQSINGCLGSKLA